MSDKPSESIRQGDNVERIHNLVRMMRKYDLSAIDLVEGPTTIRLRRRGPESRSLAVSQIPPIPAAAPQATIGVAPASAGGTALAPKPAETGVAIESPMVGTFYASSSPESPPFATIGTNVRPETTVCIIEAMKVFTEIPAGVSGKIVEVLAKDKQPVEFGQPLFRVEPS
jgi:acetyl-CoA carboxylase biotin carboxyl carrier protein